MRTGTMKGTLSALLLVTTFLPHTPVAGVNVSVTVSTIQAVSFIDKLFVGVTLDSGLVPIARHWKGLDFNNQKVQTLAKGLSPCYLRIGGTAGDSLTFYPSAHGKVDLYRSFTGATWDAVNTFVRDVKWKFIFGLNALKRKEGQWDPTNAKELLQYNSAKGYQLAGLELGNEPNHWPGTYNITVSGSQLGGDFYNFKKLLQSTPGYETTLVIGPDINPVTGKNLLADFLIGGGDRAVDRITFHQKVTMTGLQLASGNTVIYYNISHPVHLPNFTDTKVMDTLVSAIQTGLDVTRRTNPRTPVWLGETSSCGMAPGLADRYVAGFLWLDKLGIASRMGLKAVIRQDFYHGYYALIDNSTFDPLPDYWLTVLYKRLVGGAVFSVEASVDNSTIRAYAHCTKPSITYGYVSGGVTMYFLLPTDNTTSITFPQFPGQPVDVFWLTQVDGLTSKTVALNNNPLELVNNSLPELKPYRTQTNTITFPGKTFGFLVFPEANVASCSSL